MTSNYILIPLSDDIHCSCGNTPSSDGFFPCDANGNEMEPTLGSGWDGLYVCPVCSTMYKFEEQE